MKATPSMSLDCALRLGGFSSLIEALEYASLGDAGFNFYSGFGDLLHVLSYKDLMIESKEIALHLSGLNLKHGSYVGVIADTSPDFICFFYACQYAGLVPCILPSTALYGVKKEYCSQLSRMLSACGSIVLLASSNLVSTLSDEDLKDFFLFDLKALKKVSKSYIADCLGASEYAYVQFSSGSTNFPKGILIGQNAVCDNATSIVRYGLNIRAGDRAFSWLPFYHDMGFVGFFIAPIFAQCSVDYISPFSFAKRPVLWMELVSRNKATITYAPAFAYSLVAKRFKITDSIDVSCLRVAGVGGDFIRSSLLSFFSEKFREFGFKNTAWLPSYGMAEAVLAITIGKLDSGLNVKFDDGAQGVSRECIGCGWVIGGNKVVIRGDDGVEVSDGEVGSIFYKGVSLFEGYLSGGNVTFPDTDEDGFFYTGDLGYICAEQLFVVARKKELIKVRGVGFYPQDIEFEVENVFFLKAGDVISFSVECDLVVVLIQGLASGVLDKCVDLTNTIAMHLQRVFGFSPRVIFVPSKTFPLTTSGKVARPIVRERYLLGEFQ